MVVVGGGHVSDGAVLLVEGVNGVKRPFFAQQSRQFVISGDGAADGVDEEEGRFIALFL